MKSRIIKAAAIIGGAHFIAWWASVGILKASGFQLFSFSSLFGFGAAPSHTVAQEFLFVFIGILTYPLAWLSLPWEYGDRLLDILAAGSNSAVWGLCFSLVVFAIKHAVRRSREKALMI